MAEGEALKDSSWNSDLPWGDGTVFDPDALQNIPGFVVLDVLPVLPEEPDSNESTAVLTKKEWS